MKNRNYLEIIRYCGTLSFSQLKAFKELYKADKNREFMIACEVLRIKTRNLIQQSQ